MSWVDQPQDRVQWWEHLNAVTDQYCMIHAFIRCVQFLKGPNIALECMIVIL
jgi:hypothetical protein